MERVSNVRRNSLIVNAIVSFLGISVQYFQLYSVQNFTTPKPATFQEIKCLITLV